MDGNLKNRNKFADDDDGVIEKCAVSSLRYKIVICVWIISPQMLSYHATCSKVEVDRLKVTCQDSNLYCGVLEEAGHVKQRLERMVMLSFQRLL